MPRLQPQDPAAVAEAIARTERTKDDLRLLTKHFLARLAQQAPGKSVEVRVPPYAAAQVVEGVRHTRGTPPAVIELDATTWIALATGETTWTTPWMPARSAPPASAPTSAPTCRSRRDP